MTTMLAEVYDALRDIGVDDGKARRAAEVMAAGGTDVASASQVSREFASIRAEMAMMRSDIRLLQWQFGLLFAIVVPTLLLVLRLSIKLGALSF